MKLKEECEKEQRRAERPALIPLRALARRSGRFPPLPCPPPRLEKCSMNESALEKHL